MGKCKLATLSRRLFEAPPPPPPPPPPAIASHCTLSTLFNVVEEGGGGGRGGVGGAFFMYSSSKWRVCTLLKEGLYVDLCRSVAQREENTVISTNAPA